jgi:hypothetical protein
MHETIPVASWLTGMLPVKSGLARSTSTSTVTTTAREAASEKFFHKVKLSEPIEFRTVAI